MIGYVPPGLPTVQPPPFSHTTNNNGTVESEDLLDMMADLSSGIIVIPLIGLLEDIAICKAFGEESEVNSI